MAEDATEVPRENGRVILAHGERAMKRMTVERRCGDHMVRRIQCG
jgi:hypothetical protein